MLRQRSAAEAGRTASTAAAAPAAAAASAAAAAASPEPTVVYSAEDEETLGFLRQVREHVKALRTSEDL
jgi:hypothetical protein